MKTYLFVTILTYLILPLLSQKKMLESRPEDALVKLVKPVELYRL